MSFLESEILYTVRDSCIKNPEKFDDYYYIRPGESLRACFKGSDITGGAWENHVFRLMLTGEIDIYSLWRNEGSFPLLYRSIDDSLCSDVTHHSPFSLKVVSNGESYPRSAWFKIPEPAVFPSRHYYGVMDGKNILKLGIWYKKNNIRLLADGRLCFAAEVFYRRPDVDSRDVRDKPDEIYTIDLGNGTCGWTEAFLPIQIDDGIGCVLVYLSCENFEGAIWLEDPYLKSTQGFNMLPPFAPVNPYKKEFNWLGHNLSRKEWPEFDIQLNGITVFAGEQFQRIYRWPAFELDIPSGAVNRDENELVIKYISHYREALPYKLKKIGLISFPGAEFYIAACPHIVTAGSKFVLLVKTAVPGVKLKISSGSPYVIPLMKEMTVDNPGLCTIDFECLSPGPGTIIYIESEKIKNTAYIDRCVEKTYDGVLTGTGDSVYINQNPEDMEYFISWYQHHQIGNSITFRPVYRWSGGRILNNDAWKMAVKLCNAMKLFYCHMLDGRELPGSSANPDIKAMEGLYFIGRQSHEQDGAFYYWGNREVAPDEELFFDLWSRMADPGGILPVKCPVRTEKGMFSYLNPFIASDMEDAAAIFVRKAGYLADYVTRHTGPSVLFRYFYQAGIDWLGAELMYGPHEIILSALHGASIAYGKKEYGAHLAVQWSTTPHDSDGRYRRYFLSLYICYMYGVQHINTEEGLWRMEEGYADHERFSAPCIKHREIQQNFYRFIQTHSRRGEMHTPMAFLHGRYDGWLCFIRGQVWMQDSDEWRFGFPEESWDLIRVFYPRSVLDAIYKHPCPDKPQGFYSGTPFGPVDILPVEADTGVMDRYRILAFLGWNTVKSEDIDKLVDFVAKGGTLLLGWPHLFTCKRRSDASGSGPQVIDNMCIRKLAGFEFKGFIGTTIDNGNNSNNSNNDNDNDNDTVMYVGDIALNTAVPLKADKHGTPLVIENRIGGGRVIFVNIKAFPAEDSVKGLYTMLLQRMGEEVLMREKEKGWLRSSPDVGFTVYDRAAPDNLRVIYFMNIDWWSGADLLSTVHLLWGDREIEIDVERGCLNILTISQKWAVWTCDNETDIIDIHEDGENVSVRLQGMGKTELKIISKNYNNRTNTLKAVCNTGEIGIIPYRCSENIWTVGMEPDPTLVVRIEII